MLDDAGRGRDHEFEGVRVGCVAAHIEHHDRVAMFRNVLGANHQFARTGGAWPVHLAKVVAHHVAAERRELVAGGADATRVAVGAGGDRP